MNNCYLCGGYEVFYRPGNVRGGTEGLRIIECASCGLVFLSSFDHIGKEFYELSGMHADGISLRKWQVETEWDDERRFKFLKTNIENKFVLDFGCGNGGFLIRAKEVARFVAGIELERRNYDYFKKKELSVLSDICQVGSDGFDVITMFHVIEHLQDPIEMLKKIGKRLKDGGQLIIETPNANDALLGLYGSPPFSDFTYWSCHLFLYNSSTLSSLIRKAGLKLNYVKQIQRYPLSNHLYWLAKGKPGGHKAYSFIDSEKLNKEYEAQLASIGACDTIIVSCSKGVR